MHAVRRAKIARLVAGLAIVGCTACNASERTGNIVHDVLMEAPRGDRRVALAGLLEASGKACPAARRIYFQGLGKTREAFWNIDCGDDGVYAVTIPVDPNARSRIARCDALPDGRTPCFAPLPD